VNPDDLEPVELGLMLSKLPFDHALITWARHGIEIAIGRAGAKLDDDIAFVLERLTDDYAGGPYHRQNPMPEYSRLQMARYPPTGDRDLWVRYGPAGPPVVKQAEAA
jgi:hypothetical protein